MTRQYIENTAETKEKTRRRCYANNCMRIFYVVYTRHGKLPSKRLGKEWTRRKKRWLASAEVCCHGNWEMKSPYSFSITFLARDFATSLSDTNSVDDIEVNLEIHRVATRVIVVHYRDELDASTVQDGIQVQRQQADPPAGHPLRRRHLPSQFWRARPRESTVAVRREADGSPTFAWCPSSLSCASRKPFYVIRPQLPTCRVILLKNIASGRTS